MTRNIFRNKVKKVESSSALTRDAIHRLRGSFKGLGLLKALRDGRAEDLRREEAKFDRFRRRDRS